LLQTYKDTPCTRGVYSAQEHALRARMALVMKVCGAMCDSMRAAAGMSEAWDESDHAMRLRTVHEQITRACVDETSIETEARDWEQSMRTLCASFLWLLPACENSIDVADVFNGSHVTGIVLCKLIYLVLSDLCADTQSASPCTVFAACAEMHTATTTFAEHRYSELELYVHALQARVGSLLQNGHADAAAVGVVYLGYMLGRLFCAETLDAHDLDVASVRELASAYDGQFQLSKKAARGGCVVLFCLLRECVLHATARAVELVSAPVANDSVLAASMNANEKGVYVANLAPRMLANVQRVKRRRVEPSTAADAAADATLWASIVKRIGVHRMGARPRKVSPKLRALLRDICVVLNTDADAVPDAATGSVAVSESFVRVLVCALENYYVVPSAGMHRTVQLLEELLPGQRLCYAFDQTHFDTGQLSQVVFFHNPMAKHRPPPSTVDAWDRNSSAGPIAAFAQLDQALVVHAVDVQDPVGIRRETHVVARPSDAIPATDKTQARKTPLYGNSAFIVAAGGTYLVHRKSHCAYALGATRHAQFPYMALVAHYARGAGLIPEICGIAVNSCKLAAQ
jgi:hypothetical protein